METQTNPITAEIDAFIKRHGISAVTFGRSAMNDPNFVRDLHNGRRVWPETERKVRSFMETYQREAA